MQWRIMITEDAGRQLDAITDQRIQLKVRERIERLADEPEKQGKPLGDELAGCRSIRAIGQRYRILYKVEMHEVTVIVVTLGIRKQGDKADVYAVAKKLARLGLLDRP